LGLYNQPIDEQARALAFDAETNRRRANNVRGS
jgi:hypothetical protein